MKQKSVSLIIATYNWPQALKAVLNSVSRQKVLPDEVIIADDGSTEETKKVIQSFQNKFPFLLLHVWHEDKGFRLAHIRNKAIAKAKGNYIIQTDGDSILNRHFIKDHLNYRKPNLFLYGTRTHIQKKILNKPYFTPFTKGLKRRLRAIRMPFFTELQPYKDSYTLKMKGANLSFWKKDFIEVNGYDENMFGWGCEDLEMLQRMMNKGVKGKRLKHKAVIYHIAHPEEDKTTLLEKNRKRLFETKEQRREKCEIGINQYL